MTKTPQEPANDVKKTPKCPMCGRPRELNYRPFCSPRCRDKDLAKWLDGDYAVPSVEVDEDGNEGADILQLDIAPRRED